MSEDIGLHEASQIYTTFIVANADIIREVIRAAIGSPILAITVSGLVLAISKKFNLITAVEEGLITAGIAGLIGAEIVSGVQVPFSGGEGGQAGGGLRPDAVNINIGASMPTIPTFPTGKEQVVIEQSAKQKSEIPQIPPVPAA